MADPGQAGPAVAEPAGEPAPAVEPAAAPAVEATFVDAQGNFVDGWQLNAPFVPEELRNEASLNGYKNVSDALKSLVNAQHMIGKDKIAIPGETSTPDEWNEFHRAAGRPETPGDYNITRPEAVPEELFDKELANGYQELFHKIGISSKQAEALVGFNVESTLATIAKQEASNENDRQVAMKALTEKHGSVAYEGRLNLSKKALDVGADGDEELRKVIAERYGNDPDFVNWTANIGKQFGEASAVAATEAATIGSLEQQVTELTATDAYRNNQHPDHANMQLQVERIFKEIAATRPPKQA